MIEEKFIDKYWKLPPTAEEIDRIVRKNHLSIPEQNLYGILESAKENHLRYLREKHGDKVMAGYDELAAKHIQLSSDKTYHDLFAFMFEAGLTADMPIETVLRTRSTLDSLLTALGNKQEFTLADLGCGDGKISIGLALGLNKLKKLYAIDVSPYALARLENNIRELSDEQQERVRKVIVPVNRDYMDEEILNEKVDVALSAYPFVGWQLLPQMVKLKKPTGEVLIYIDIAEWEDPKEVARHFNEHGRALVMDFRVAHSQPFWLGCQVMGCMGKD